MLKTRLLHPEILAALGEAGHGAQVLIADGNYPLATRSNPDAYRVFLNLEPGKLTVTDVLDVIADAIPVEAAYVMGPDDDSEPSIYEDFRGLLPDNELTRLGRFEFYDMARGPDCALAIATGEQRIYANILLTIGVVMPEQGTARTKVRQRIRLASQEIEEPMASVNTSGRFVGDWPKIGIRPVVDGRQHGVRESLEEQTRNMALRTAKLISETLRYPDGSPVECVVPDHNIGGVYEAAKVAELFRKEGVGVSLTITPCWCYGAETMDMDPLTPKAVWGFNGTERPGAVYLAAVLAAHTQKGLPAFGIYGRDVQDASDGTIPGDVQAKILRFAKAGMAAAILRGKSYLSLGGVSMGIAGSIVDQPFFEKYLGMRVEAVDMSEIYRRLDRKIYDPVEFETALAWAKANCTEGTDRNPADTAKSREELDADWETVVRMALITRDLLVGNPKLAEMGHVEESHGKNAILGGFQGQRHWTDHSPNGDFMEAILNSSFDWNGIRAPHIFATENDSLNGSTMLLSYLLTNRAQIFADVRTYWSPDAVERVTGFRPDGLAADGFIHLINSGAATLDATGAMADADGKPAMKPFWEISEADVEAALAATTWYPANLGYFRGGGFSSQFVSKGGMPVTMARLNLVSGVGPVLQIAEGWTVELPKEVHDVLDQRTDPTWPTHWFVPRTTGSGAFRDVYTVMANWAANHGAISYGHIGADLISLAAVLRIPVHMHNVPEEDIFRPSAWANLGTADLEGADFRACANFGPLYGRK